MITVICIVAVGAPFILGLALIAPKIAVPAKEFQDNNILPFRSDRH
jgi:hypothetical protein